MYIECDTHIHAFYNPQNFCMVQTMSLEKVIKENYVFYIENIFSFEFRLRAKIKDFPIFNMFPKEF